MDNHWFASPTQCYSEEEGSYEWEHWVGLSPVIVATENLSIENWVFFCQQQKLSICEVSWVYVSYDCQPCIVNQILNITFSFCSKPCHHLNFTLSIATTMMSHDNISNYGVTNGDHQHLMGCVLCISIFKPHLKLPSKWEKETTITITIASNNNKLHSLCPKTDEAPVSLITDGGLPYQMESPSTKL